MQNILRYSLVIERTGDPEFFGYYSPDLPGYTGTGTSVEDCKCRAMAGFDEYIKFIEDTGGAAPEANPSASVSIV